MDPVANIELGNSSVKTIWQEPLCPNGGQRDALTLMLTVNYWVQHNTVDTIQYGTVQYGTVLDNTVQYNTGWYSQYNTIRYCTI